MRIVYLINAPGPGVSGAGQHTLSLAAQDLARGDEPLIVAPHGSGMLAAATSTGVSSTEAPMTALPWDVATLRSVVAAADADVVHAMSFVPLVLAGVLGRPHAEASGRARRPATFVSYLVDPASHLPMARARFRRLALWIRNNVARRYGSRVDAIFTVSSTIAERLKELGIEGRIIVARGGIDIEQLRERALATFDAPDRHPRIGWAAVDQVPSKGSGVLVEALATVVRTYPDAVCMLTGRTSPELDIPALARSFGVGDHVIMLGLIDDPAPFVRGLDLYVMPSLSEALNTSIMEAMALGVPVVATNVGGTAEIVEDGTTGLLVAPGDAAALAAAMLRVLDDAHLSERIAEAGRQRVEAEFDRRRLYEITAAEYRRATTLA